MISIDIWALLTMAVGLLGSIFGAAFTAGKIVAGLYEKRQDERFKAQEKAREETRRHWDQKFAALEQAANRDTEQWRNVERELLQLKADLPEKYVRHEDYVRGQSTIEMKIDRVALKIENLQLRTQMHEQP
ncbi:hypothetical protein [Methylococcus mesophilus]|uniref:hypothetical protein n=1 Tax=Methylococcus mesophilus TaxID=2993564 RepID=UPI00224A8299|nr:hypothetical protein [Methylococcus mesophilus]UZR27442.1 hypothetical protein OOT43_11925 [Methylococcus mesophilus]